MNGLQEQNIHVFCAAVCFDSGQRNDQLSLQKNF